MRNRSTTLPVGVALLVGLLVAGAVTILVGGWGWPRAGASAGASDGSGAARTVKALTRDAPAAEVRIPGDFPAVMGYRPVSVSDAGRPELIRADGGCSSPWGDTRYGFGIACRQHDLGYDLLRFAAAEHHPLGRWARAALDGHFQAAVLARCDGLPVADGVGCRVAAAVYVAALRFNSWRQGEGVPVVEALPALLAPGGVGLLAGLLAGWLAASARARRGLGRTLRRALGTPLAPLGLFGLHRRAGRLLFCSLALAVCLQPAAVPRPVWVQVLVGGLVAAHLYLLATPVSRLLARVTARLGHFRPRPQAQLGLAVAALAVSAATSAMAQARLDGTVGATPRSPALLLLGTPAAALGGAGVVLLLRATRRALGLLATRAVLVVRRSPVQRRLVAVLLAPALVLGIGGTAAAAPLPAAPVYGASTDVAGGVGAKGRQFLAGGPAGGLAGGAAGAKARPVRVYVGRDQAGSAAGRARLAVRELRRAGGFDRSVVLIAVPTGSGWVNGAAVGALERQRHGDVATVAVQYAASPSWVSYLRGGDGVQGTVRAVTQAVRAEVSRRPPGRRPTVFVYGESLGAWGGLRAYPDPASLLRRVDGALWVGVPAGSGRSAAGSPRVLTVVHANDPVPAWTPSLLVRPDPAWRHPWLPVISFWRETADVIAADSTPLGHGHRYGPELAGAWRSLLAATDLQDS